MVNRNKHSKQPLFEKKKKKKKKAKFIQPNQNTTMLMWAIPKQFKVAYQVGDPKKVVCVPSHMHQGMIGQEFS